MRHRISGTLALGAAAALVLTAVPAAAQAEIIEADGFVSTQGTEFVLDGEPFTVLGSNNYYPMYAGAPMVDALFEKAADTGFTTMRVWGFFDIGSPGGGDKDTIADGDKGVYFQYWDDAAGAPAFNDGATGLEQLDYVVAKAGEEGLRLILPLTNNWSAFGGMDQYNIWAGSEFHSDFYTDPAIKGWYKDWAEHLLERTNTITGVVYKDDPTIMAWELANEPRCIGDGGPADGSWGTGLFPRDPACTAETITPWVEEMSAHLKSIDPNHLVTTGDEGFFNHPDGADWQYDGTDGVDTEAWASVDTIDYMSYHLYPDHWGTDAAWGAQWIVDHNASAEAIGKPALLGEFGWQDKATRNAVYRLWLDTQLETGGAGSLYWILSDDREDGTPYPDYDGFTVYCPSPVCTTIANQGALIADPAADLPPVADHDPVAVDFGAVATVDALANDRGYGAAMNPATLDLDPATAGVQVEAETADGVASVDDLGGVTVTPAAGFSGVLEFPYVVADTAGRLSNVATITVAIAPDPNAWVVVEDFEADASRWTCDGTATVTVEEGVGVFTNDTGGWAWCMFTPSQALDLSDAELLRFDFVGTDSGVNPEVALKVGAAWTWDQVALDEGIWNEPKVGDDAPTVTLARFQEATVAELGAVHQIGIGVHPGTHRFDDLRYAGAQSPAPAFVDVSNDPASPAFSEHHEAIAWMASEGISTGWATQSGLEFRPLARTTRDAMAAFLYRLAGSPALADAEATPFVDVSSNPASPLYSEHWQAILWMAEQGLAEGWDNGEGSEFRPLSRVSRDAVAAFLYREAGSPALADPEAMPFVDVSADPSAATFSEHAAAIEWMAQEGLATGWGTPESAEFRPRASITRDAIAAFLYRVHAN